MCFTVILFMESIV